MARRLCSRSFATPYREAVLCPPPTAPGAQASDAAAAAAEQRVVDAEMMAIEEINDKGGLLGKRIKPILPRGAQYHPLGAPCHANHCIKINLDSEVQVA